MHIYIRIIKIILQSIQYRNKELLLELIKAELISSSGYLTDSWFARGRLILWAKYRYNFSTIEFKTKIITYIEEFLPWRIHHKKGITVTAGSTKLALRGVFSTLHIDLFFPKVHQNIDELFKDDNFMAFALDEKYDLTR